MLNLVVLMVVTVGLISIATLKITASSILKQKLMSGNILVNSIQSTLDSIFQGDPEAFQEGRQGLRLARLVRSFGRESAFKALFIIDREHRVIAHSEEGAKVVIVQDHDIDEAISSGKVVTRFGKGGKWFYWGISDQLIISAPIYVGSRIVGAIRANLSLLDVQRSIVRTQQIILLYIVFDSVIIIILGGFLLSRSIVKPVKELLRATEKISEGDFSQRTGETGINEISQLSLSFNRMSRRLGEYVESLERTNTELKQAQEEVIRSEKLASVGRLAAGIAHEIGNPIGAILGYVHILENGVDNTEEEKDYLRRIEDESNRISSIINDLLDFSRPSSVKIDEVNVNQIIGATISLLSPQKILENIRVDLKLEEDLPSVFIDQNQLQQVIVNLIINASDAMPDGGDLTIQTTQTLTHSEVGRDIAESAARRRDDPTHVDYSYLRKDYGRLSVYQEPKEPGRYVTVMVSDTGCGIKKEDRSRIFDPFYTTKPPGKGTGLGLTTCLRIIESFGGHIDVESQEGKGTTFAILLPVGKGGP
ncbi:MAG: ATP-binding protein [Pseudomonadota bacterium]